MTDLKQMKSTLLKMKCNFSSVRTLVGHTITVNSETHEMMFEFDNEENFTRTISGKI